MREGRAVTRRGWYDQLWAWGLCATMGCSSLAVLVPMLSLSGILALAVVASGSMCVACYGLGYGEAVRARARTAACPLSMGEDR